MKRNAKILGLLLAGLCIATGCGKEQVSPATLPPVTEKTIWLEELNLQAENLSPYEGVYIEQGEADEKVRVSGVYALAFTNTSEQTIADAHLVFSDGSQELNFYFEMLPYGSTTTVVEYDKKEVKSTSLQLVGSTVNYLKTGLENMDCLQIVDSEMGMLGLENMTFADLPELEIYYRRGNPDGGTIGGPCYVIRMAGVEAREVFYPEVEFWSEKCEIVNILLYPEVSDGS